MDKNEARNHLIQSIWSMAEVPLELIDRLISICRLKEYKKGETFLEAGRRPEMMGFNLNGIFRLFNLFQAGRSSLHNEGNAGKKFFTG